VRRFGYTASVVTAASVAVWWLLFAAGPAPRGQAAPPPVPFIGLTSPAFGPPLPAGTTHGLAMRLRQYPDLALARPVQRLAAERLLRQLRATALRWADPRLAAAAGFDMRRPRRRPGETRVMWFHSENRAWHSDNRYLDPTHPDTLIYADLPGRPLVLVGVMISMPRGMRGPTPGGPITRWHSHLVCVGRDDTRGLQPRANGTCPPGATLRQGSEMMHIWFTHDLRSAFAIHAPGPELCRAALLPRSLCRDPHALHVM
jgi:hypothetical protein